MKLQIKTALIILKPAHEVFEAIVDPAKMTQYFISESSGRMEAGKTLEWKFPEFDMRFPVRVEKVEKDKYISFYWDDVDGTPLLVEMTLTEKGPDATFLEVSEKERESDEAGIEWYGRNTGGWANFLAFLKAYVEYGINMRNGAFDISQMPEQK